MTVVDHLTELRRRLIICVAAVAVGAVVAYVLYDRILSLLVDPLEQGFRGAGIDLNGLNVSGVTTPFTFRMKVSAFGGVLFGLPVILWQVWRFVTPGLEPREKRFAVPFLLSSIVLFGSGAYLGYIFLPKAIEFLIGFAGAELQPLIFVDEYLSFTMRTILVFGLAFEFPILLVFLALVGVTTSRKLAKARRFILFGAFVAAAILTPSGDPLTMTALAVPMHILYEIALLVIRFGMKR